MVTVPGCADELTAFATRLDSDGLHQHIVRGFGRPVAVPSAQEVIGDAPDTRGDGREDAAFVSRHTGNEVFCEQSHPKGVDSEHLVHLLTV